MGRDMTPLKAVLWGNAIILVIGTYMQASESPFRHTVLSILFLAWCGLLAWHLLANRATAE